SGPSRTDTVYLDVSLSEVDRTVDSDLGNSGDVGVQTTVRQKLNFTVRVAQDSTALPPSSPGHSFFLLARLNRPATAQIDAQSITDLRARFIPLLQASGLIRELARPVLDPSPNEFSPESAVAGTTFTLFGRNFGIGQTSIRFVTTTTPPTTVPITTGFVATDTQITGQLPANIPVGIYKIIIENEHGSDTTTNAFKVITPGGGLPVFGAPGGQFTPTAGGPGTQVTIFGSNFTNTMTLMFFFLPLIDTSFKATDLSIASIDIEPGPQPQVLPFQFLTSGKIAAEIPGSVTEGQIRFRIMVGTSVVADSSDIFTISGGLPSA
ncbi:MAG TPA: hypothetical protein VFV34_06415, partial [Blastocatellia bacterium]|nr:hypothetical protein [Blastocatellia bacterium]